MSMKLRNLQKSTTKSKFKPKPNIILILEEVGLSHEPLSSYEIKNKVIGSGDIYRYIRKLCPLLRERGQLLFNLNGVKNGINNHRYKLDLLKKINDIYKLNLNITDADSKYPLLSNKEIGEIINSIIKITYKKNRICIYFKHYVIGIDYNSNGEDNNIASLLVIDRTKKYDNNHNQDAIIKEANLIKIKNNKSGIAFYSENKKESTKLKYRLLNVSLNVKTQNEVDRIKKEQSEENPELTDLDLDFLPEVISIRKNTKNWLYSLNLRGLIYYINYNNNNNNQKILEILTNPILLKHALFLYNCQFFKEIGFPLEATMINISRDYSNVRYSKYYDDSKLNQSITDRYLDEISNYFGLYESKFALKKDIDPAISAKFKEYLFMWKNKKFDIEKELQITEKIINQLDKIK